MTEVTLEVRATIEAWVHQDHGDIGSGTALRPHGAYHDRGKPPCGGYIQGGSGSVALRGTTAARLVGDDAADRTAERY